VIRAWNIETAETRVFMGHKGWVLCLVINNGRLFSASDDRTIRVWDIQTARCLEEFLGHDDGIGCLAFADGMLYSGS
jgi:WD40 repeat protein